MVISFVGLMISVKSLLYGYRYTNFVLQKSCGLDVCNSWIIVTGDSLPNGFYLSGNGTNDVKITTAVIEKWNQELGEITYSDTIVHVTTNSQYMMSSPIIEKVIYNGMNIEKGECHYVNEMDSQQEQIISVCYNSDTLAQIKYNTESEPYWYHLLWNMTQTSFNNIYNSITSILNTLTNLETRISTLEGVTTVSTTTIGTTTVGTTTTTIGVCKLKYEKCTKNDDCCQKVCNRNTGRCSL